MSSLHPGWPEATPTVLMPAAGPFAEDFHLRLRPVHRGDGRQWREMRLLDEPYLRPVEPTVPVRWGEAHSRRAWWNHLFELRAAAKQGSVVPFSIEVNGTFAGQVTLGNIQPGAISECWIGYWVHSALTGAGIATVACGLGTDHAIHRVGLHRVTATFMPGNPASGKVLANNGFRQEGYLKRNLHIDGRWQDHVFVALDREDFSEPCVVRLRDAGRVL